MNVDALKALAEAVDDGTMTDKHIMQLPLVKWGSLVCASFDGSLDAAKALHDAVLPGWEWGRTEGNIYVKDPARGAWSIRWGGPNDVASRSWLLAIIRALIAQAEKGEG